MSRARPIAFAVCALVMLCAPPAVASTDEHAAARRSRARWARIASVFTPPRLGPLAAVGAADDPQEGGPLDLRQVRHSDDGSSVTHEAQMWSDVPADKLSELGWLFDFDSDGSTDTCIAARWDGSALRADVFGKGCAGVSTGSATITRSAPGTFRAVLAIDTLRAGGLTGSRYRYRVQSSSASSVSAIFIDKLPDEGKPAIVHQLGAAGEPVPASAPVPAIAPESESSSTVLSRARAASAGSAADQADGALPASGGPIALTAFAALSFLAGGFGLVAAGRDLRRSARPPWELRREKLE